MTTIDASIRFSRLTTGLLLGCDIIRGHVWTFEDSRTHCSYAIKLSAKIKLSILSVKRRDEKKSFEFNSFIHLIMRHKEQRDVPAERRVSSKPVLFGSKTFTEKRNGIFRF